MCRIIVASSEPRDDSSFFRYHNIFANRPRMRLRGRWTGTIRQFLFIHHCIQRNSMPINKKINNNNNNIKLNATHAHIYTIVERHNKCVLLSSSFDASISRILFPTSRSSIAHLGVCTIFRFVRILIVTMK